jgi:hypothetical protein
VSKVVEATERVVSILKDAGHVQTGTVAGADKNTRIVFRKAGFIVEPYRGETVKVAFKIAGQADERKVLLQTKAYAATLREHGIDVLVKHDVRTCQVFLLAIITDNATLPESERCVPHLVDRKLHDKQVKPDERVDEVVFPAVERPIPATEYDAAFVLKCRRALVEIQAESFRNGMKRAYARALVAWFYGERHVMPTWPEYCLTDETGDAINRKLADLFHGDAVTVVRQYREMGVED